MTESVEQMEEEGAPAEARSKAYDEIEEEFFRDSAFADCSDSDKEEEMRRTQDFNDAITHSGNEEVEMNLFYMCAKTRQQQLRPQRQVRPLHVRKAVGPQRRRAGANKSVVLRLGTLGLGRPSPKHLLDRGRSAQQRPSHRLA